jgi:S1-C subfamily serine protease
VVPGGSGRAYEAVLVYFDPDMDLAVLAVADLPAKPLQFAADEAERGDNLAVLGYPENGPLAITPARVRAIQEASGSDIYGKGTVVRQVISMRADVRPGNSGGPVVDQTGDVVGVVFANSLDSDDTGYAMTSDAVASAITDGVAVVDFVSSGPCT